MPRLSCELALVHAKLTQELHGGQIDQDTRASRAVRELDIWLLATLGVCRLHDVVVVFDLQQPLAVETDPGGQWVLLKHKQGRLSPEGYLGVV